MAQISPNAPKAAQSTGRFGIAKLSDELPQKGQKRVYRSPVLNKIFILFKNYSLFKSPLPFGLRSMAWTCGISELLSIKIDTEGFPVSCSEFSRHQWATARNSRLMAISIKQLAVYVNSTFYPSAAPQLRSGLPREPILFLQSRDRPSVDIILEDQAPPFAAKFELLPFPAVQ